MPLAIEFESSDGQKIGVVHAAVPDFDWDYFDSDRNPLEEGFSLWDREQLKDSRSRVDGVDFVCHGHSVIQNGRNKGNRIYLDTGFYYTGIFGFVEF